jgi:natural resistance-associated macrophage protein
VDANLYKAGIFLGCSFGLVPMYIWAIGIFAAGQSSTMTGTYAGQFAMEGFLNISWSRWKRVLLTRTIAIFPTLFVTIFQHIDDLSGMNDLLNALMSLMLPFALLPTLTFSSSHKVMGNFRNGFINKILVSLLSVVVIVVNLYFVVNFVSNSLPQVWWVYTLTALFFLYYLTFVAYLTGCFLVVLGVDSITRIPKLGQYMEEKHSLDFGYDCDYRNINDGNLSSQGSSPPSTPSTLCAR